MKAWNIEAEALALSGHVSEATKTEADAPLFRQKALSEQDIKEIVRCINEVFGTYTEDREYLKLLTSSSVTVRDLGKLVASERAKHKRDLRR